MSVSESERNIYLRLKVLTIFKVCSKVASTATCLSKVYHCVNDGGVLKGAVRSSRPSLPVKVSITIDTILNLDGHVHLDVKGLFTCHFTVTVPVKV